MLSLRLLRVALFMLLSFGHLPQKAAVSTSVYGSYSYSPLNPYFMEGGSQEYILHYVVSLQSYHAFYATLRNSKTIEEKNQGRLSSEYYPLIQEATYRKEYRPGDSIAVKFILPAKYAVEGANTIFLKHYNLNYSAGVYTHASQEASTFSIWGMRSKTFENADLIKDGSFSRGFPTVSHLFKNGKDYNSPYQYEFQGFRASYENPAYNRLPLEKLLIRTRNCELAYEAFPYGEAWLKLSGDIDDVGIGTLVTEADSTYRSFPLSFAKTTDNFYRFLLKDTYYVSSDGRYMRTAENKESTDVATHDFYLPPYENGKPRNFVLEVSLRNFGDCGYDNVHYRSAILKNKNLIGSCGSSQWCVGGSHP
jgi:hypothetical protein